MLVKVPVAKSPPTHVYADGPGAAAIADPVGSASATAAASDARILRRIAFSMGVDPFSRPSRATRLYPVRACPDGAGSVSPLAQRRLGDRIGTPRWWNPSPDESSHPAVGRVCIAAAPRVQ